MTTIRDELDQLAGEANRVLGRNPIGLRPEGGWNPGHLQVNRAAAGWCFEEVISVRGATKPVITGYFTQAQLAPMLRAFIAGAKAMRDVRDPGATALRARAKQALPYLEHPDVLAMEFAIPAGVPARNLRDALELCGEVL